MLIDNPSRDGSGSSRLSRRRRSGAGMLGSKGCGVFLFLVDSVERARQHAQVFSSLLAGSEGFERKEESSRS